jgi:hypothetical protein
MEHCGLIKKSVVTKEDLLMFDVHNGWSRFVNSLDTLYQPLIFLREIISTLSTNVWQVAR